MLSRTNATRIATCVLAGAPFATTAAAQTTATAATSLPAIEVVTKQAKSKPAPAKKAVSAAPAAANPESYKMTFDDKITTDEPAGGAVSDGHRIARRRSV